MTIAEVNVRFELALPQGWTTDDVRERIAELLAENMLPDNGVVDFEVETVNVNADPFGREWKAKIQSAIPKTIEQLAYGKAISTIRENSGVDGSLMSGGGGYGNLR